MQASMLHPPGTPRTSTSDIPQPVRQHTPAPYLHRGHVGSHRGRKSLGWLLHHVHLRWCSESSECVHTRCLCWAPSHGSHTCGSSGNGSDNHDDVRLDQRIKLSQKRSEIIEGDRMWFATCFIDILRIRRGRRQNSSGLRGRESTT